MVFLLTAHADAASVIVKDGLAPGVTPSSACPARTAVPTGVSESLCVVAVMAQGYAVPGQPKDISTTCAPVS
jgi:hypothetical protein